MILTKEKLDSSDCIALNPLNPLDSLNPLG